MMRKSPKGIGLLLLLLAALMLGGLMETGHSAGEKVTPIFERALANAPGKKLVAVRLDYAAGAKSVPHHHAPSAFIYAYVLSGEIRSQVSNESVRVYRTGESFYEDPGSAHGISENASRTRPASLSRRVRGRHHRWSSDHTRQVGEEAWRRQGTRDRRWIR